LSERQVTGVSRRRESVSRRRGLAGEEQIPRCARDDNRIEKNQIVLRGPYRAIHHRAVVSKWVVPRMRK